MDFHLIKEEDKPSVMRLWAYCFENEEDPFYNWYFNNFFNSENTLGSYSENKLMANLQLNPYQIYVRGKALDTSYIVGIATDPAARGQGIVRGLMVESFREMKRRKHFVSILMPYRAHFYYPYDFEFVYHHLKYVIPISDLKRQGAGYGEFRQIDENYIKNKNDYQELQEVYDKFTKNKHGYVVRTEENWRLLVEEHLTEKGYITLLLEQGKPIGYLFYYLQDNRFIVKEMAFANINAQKSLLKYIYNHNSQVETLEWNAAVDDLTYLSLPDPKQGITMYPFMMARIIDAKEALESIDYSRDITGTIKISISDNLATWNEGTFKVEINEGKAKVTKTLEPSDVNLGIGTLTSLYFGRLSASELEFLGKISSGSAKKMELLTQIFPKMNNFINEYI